MGRIAIAVLIAAACAISGAQAQSSRPLPPVEAFGSLPFINDPQLSPDGKHFAAIQERNGRPAAVIYQVNAPVGAQPLLYQDPKWTVAGLSWAKSDRLIIFVKKYSDFDYTIFSGVAVGPDDGSTMNLGFNFSMSTVLDKDITDPDFIFLPLWIGRSIIVRVNIHTGHADQMATGREFPTQWILDGNGNVVARVDRLHHPLTDKLRVYQAGSWTDPSEFNARADNGANVEGVSLDGKSLVLLSRGERDSLSLFNLASAKVGDSLYANDRYDIDGGIEDEWTGRVVGAAYIADRVQYYYFDRSREAVQRGIEVAFPGTEAHAVSTNLSGDKMIVLTDAPRQPPTYYYLDRTTHQATRIASAYPALEPDDLGEMQPYPYKARDGLDVAAYLTIPPGRGSKNLPLIVMPHGGPDARDYLRFDWWAQFLANRGYAVFQPNFRGSKGYGRAFTEAGLHQWGLKMQDDITDGVKKLIADGVADPNRICIVGASYGGYAALAGATFTPDLYKCAASFAGVSNLQSLLERFGANRGDINTSRASFWISRIGDLSSDTDRLDATSPALHADRVKIPILLMHGKNDNTVPIEQSELERDALEAAGKKVTFIKFDGDDHYFSLAATRIGMLTQLEKFLHDNIGS